MKSYKILLLFLTSLFTFFFCSCRKKQMPIKELKEYMRNEENGLKQVVEKNGVKMEAYLIRPEIIGVYDNRIFHHKDSLRYFLLSFSKQGREALPQVENIDQYAQLINNLSFSSARYCHLVEQFKDTLEVVNSSFLNTYGTNSSNDLLLVFKSKNSKSDCKLVVDEMGFGLGSNKFSFKKSDVENFYKIHVNN